MAGEQVRQELILDAQRAIAELRKLRGELTQANTQLLNTGSVISQVNKAGAGLPGTIERSARAMGQFRQESSGLNPQLASNVQQIKLLDQAIKQLEGTTSKSGKSILLSWQSVTRIFVGDIIRRSLLAIGRGMIELGAESHRLQISLARVLTISDQFGGNLNGLTDRVRAFAAANAENREEISKALYDVLTNQVTDGAKAFDVLSAAQKLTLATGTDLTKSISTVSAVIRSYRLSADDAAEVSGKLFRIVDIGRFKIDDISNSFGRVTQLGNAVGASFDEIGASIATLSDAGIDADESMTLLNNVFLALLKPSEKMRAAFQKLGVDTAQAGVTAAGGFIPFLTQLERVAPEVGAELSELTGNIRGLRGLLGLGGENAKLLASNLDKVKGGANAANIAAAQLNATLARQTELATAKASAALSKLADFATKFGSIWLIGAIQSAENFGTSVKRLLDLSGLTDFAAADQLTKELEGLKNNAIRLAKERVDGEKEHLDRSLKNVVGYLNERRKIEIQAHNEGERLQRQLFGGINAQIQSRINAFSSLSKAVTKLAQEGDGELKELGFGIQDAEREFANLKQDRFALRFDDGGIRRVATSLAQVNDLRREALDLLKSQDPLEQKRGEELLKQAQALSKQTLSQADSTNNIALIGQSERAVNELHQDRIRLLKEQEKLKHAQVGQAKKEQVAIEAQDKEINTLFDDLQKFQDKSFSGGVISEDDAREVLNLTNKIDLALQKAFRSPGRVDLANLLGLKDFAQAARQQFTAVSGEFKGKKVSLQFAADEAIASLRQQFESTFKATPAKLTAELSLIGVDLSNARSIEQAVQATLKRKEVLQGELSKLQTQKSDVDTAFQQAAKKVEETFTDTVKRMRLFVDENNPIRTLIESIRTATIGGNIPALEALRLQLDARQKQAEAIQAGVLAKPAGDRTKQDAEVLGASTAIIEEIKRIKAAADNAIQGIQNLQPLKVPVELADASIDKITNDINALSAAASQVAQPIIIPSVVAPPTVGENNQMGGRVGRYQKGGFAQQGTDSILAALTAGEHVTPVRQSREFATQLAAIGAGMRPVGRQAGGTVNNITIGDVHAALPQGSTPVQLRALQDHLKRAVRKGAFKLS